MHSAAQEKESLLPTTINSSTNNSKNEDLQELKAASPAYISSFDGLRGLSVVAVHVSHLLPLHMSRTHRAFGAVGLNVFFIMSGYLVTGVLMGQQIKTQAKTGSRYGHLLSCYRNRYARLYPAMFVVVVSTALIQRYVQGRMPEGWFNNMANALLYLANLEPFHPYTKSIWKHTYSMATQEQWYLLWSLCLPFLLATTRRNRNAVMLAVILISYLGHSAWTAGLYIHSPLFDTFGLLTWIGKLQVGAFMRLNTIPQFLRSKWAVWVGLVLFTFSALDATYGSDDNIEWLGLSRRFFSREIYNTYAALVVSIFLVAGSIYNSVWLFDTQALRFMGRISYSWFLFQVPLLEIVGWPRNYVGIAITCMAYVMASFSTIYIEERIKDLNKAIRTARSKPSRSDNEVAVSKS